MNELLKPDMIKMSPGKPFAKRLQLPTPVPEPVTNGFGIPPMVLSLLEVCLRGQ
jgi:hypothetical protein